jgi:osmotically-inducible protein OsmY
MTRTFVTVATAALLVTIPACSRGDRQSAATDQSAAEERIARDDTAANTRDAVTAQDQSESATDRALTRRIRQAIVADDSLSTRARNVTVSATDGVVTLRGRVANEQERNAVAAKAEGTAGVKGLDNQLEVTGPHS